MAKPKDKNSINDLENTSEISETIQDETENTELANEANEVESLSVIKEFIVDIEVEKTYPPAVKALKKFSCQISNRPNSSVVLSFREGEIITDEHTIKTLIDNSCPVERV